MTQAPLLPSLARVVRGLSTLFWGLPFALLACIRTSMGDLGAQGGIWLPLASCILIWFGLRQLASFQTQERIWINALARAEIFALANCALAPCTWWWNRNPSSLFFAQSILLLLFSALAFLFALNHVLRRLAALLPDETLRTDIRFFTRLNAALILCLTLIAGAWSLSFYLPIIPESFDWIIEAIEQNRLTLIVTLGLLPVAVTMTLIWKAKEAIVADVFHSR